MKTYINKNYPKKIKMRIRIYSIMIVIMLIYMFVIGELGLGDSRKMSSLASDVGRYIIFGGLLYLIIKIVSLRKILRNEKKLLEEFQYELDERKQYIYDKSGGIVVDILLVILLFITCSLAMYDNMMFNTAFAILIITVGLKFISYLIYSRIY